MTGYELLAELLAAKSRYEEIQCELAALQLSVQRNRPETMTIDDCRNLLETFTILLTTAMEEARIGERVIAGNLETEDVVSLDGSAADMWEALINEDSEKAVLAALSTLYDVDPAALQEDLLTFVDDLQQRGLAV